jgi:hypothetical protein
VAAPLRGLQGPAPETRCGATLGKARRTGYLLVCGGSLGGYGRDLFVSVMIFRVVLKRVRSAAFEERFNQGGARCTRYTWQGQLVAVLAMR